jgi:hypothetical protein
MDVTQLPAPGYQVTPAALAEAARGVEDVLGELRSLGVGAGRAEAGRGVWALAARTGPSGPPGPGAAFEAFCSRWEWGVRALVRAGREMAEGLAAAGVAYAGADHDHGGLFQRILSGGDVAADRPWADVGRSVSETWSAVGRDVAENSGPGMLVRALEGDDPLQGHLDDVARLHEIVE